jgi:hypothetical protein
VSCPSVTADVDESSNVNVNLTTKIAFNPLLAIHYLSDAGEIRLGKISHSGVTCHTSLGYDILGLE